MEEKELRSDAHHSSELNEHAIESKEETSNRVVLPEVHVGVWPFYIL